jgi:hypothetical protein
VAAVEGLDEFLERASVEFVGAELDDEFEVLAEIA